MRAVSIRVITAIAVAACSSCSSSDELVVQTVDSLPRPFNTGPIPGVRVQVNDSDWVTTDANGTVTFTNVAPPFTVRAVLTSTTASVESSVVREMQGLNTNPVVVRLGQPHHDSRHASIAGSVTNVAPDGGPVVSLMAASPISVPLARAAADRTFQFNASWDQNLPATQNVVLHAFQVDNDSLPTHYTGYGSSSVPVSDPVGQGASVSGVTIPLAPVAETHITAHVTLPAGLVVGGLFESLSFVFLDESRVSFCCRNYDPGYGPPNSIDYTVPVVGEQAAEIYFFVLNFEVSNSVTSHRRRVAIRDGKPVTGIALDIGAAVALVEPAEGAAVGTDTVFRWTAGPAGATYTLFVQCDLGGTPHVFRAWEIETKSTDTRLVQTPFFTLVSGTACNWSVSWADGDVTAPQGLRQANTGFRSAVLR